MNRLRPLFLSFLLFAFAFAIASMAYAGPAANDPPKTEEVSMTAYLHSWGIVLLGLVLGFLVVLKPSNRRNRAKPVQYEVKAEKEGH
jgi:hypothetical protein